MAIIREDTKGKIRDLPIHDTLRTVLTKAANAVDIAVVRVTSGGQCHKGTCTKRTGSTRHDGGYAADLQLLVDGQRALDFTKPDDLAVVSAFVTAAAALGATGSGAAVDYTGSTTLHVGFGTSPKDRSRLVWGAGGASAHAPGWLQKAAQKGWHSPKIAAAQEVEPAIGPFVVAARDGLNLRGAPRFEAPILSVLDAGAVVTVFAFDGVLGDWARIDVQGDGLFDGHVHRAFLKPIGPLQQTEEDFGADPDGFGEEADEPDAGEA